MDEEQKIKSVGNELARRAPISLVLENWRFWYSGLVIFAIAIVLVVVGVSLSLTYSDWGLLSRFGALEVILGSLLIGRPVWRRRFKSRFVTVTIFTDGKLADEQLAEYIMERTDIWFFYIGFAIAAAGSVVWGFADLLNCLEPSDAYRCTTSALDAR